jgi:hypothetical protein
MATTELAAHFSAMLRGMTAFVSDLFAITGMYERKVVYVRHRLPL